MTDHLNHERGLVKPGAADLEREESLLLAPRRQQQLDLFAALSQAISAGPEVGLDELIGRVAALAVQALECDLVVILLFHQASGQLVVQGSYPQLNRRVLQQRPITLDQQTWQDVLHGQEQARERLNPVRDASYKTLLSAPLLIGNESLGLMNCYSQCNRQGTTGEEQMLLQIIANQTAVAIKNRLLTELVAQKHLVQGFLDELISGIYDELSLRQRASALGMDLSRPHVLALIDMGAQPAGLADAAPVMPGEEQAWQPENQAGRTPIASDIRRRLLYQFPGSLISEQQQRLTCLLNLSKGASTAQLTSWLSELVQQVYADYQLHLCIGLSNPCHQLADYRKGFIEASEALQTGQSQNASGSITAYGDLGVYRYLYQIARLQEGRDPFQEEVARIAAYDRKRGSELLDTLETFLECAGNLTETARKLAIHRNTLIQRLERMQSLCEIDLQEHGNWLALQIAIKVFRLRG